MKTLPCFFVCLVMLIARRTAHAQAVIEKLTFAESLQKAGREGKVLMVVMDAKINKQANKTTSEGRTKQINTGVSILR